MVCMIATSHWLLPKEFTLLRGILGQLYYVPIFLGALSRGWKGGIAVAVFSIGAIFVDEIYLAGLPVDGQLFGEAIDYLLLGSLSGFLLDREQKYASQIAEQTTKLDRLYRDLQGSVEQVRRSERLSAVGQLAAGLAHELRHPLASLTGAVNLLRSDTLSEPKRTECLDITERECERMARLVADLLDFAKPRPPEIALVALEPILDRVATLTAHAVGRKEVRIKKDIDPGLPAIYCDPKQIEQVILNLAINAAQATPGEATVELRALREDRRVRIEVIDQGVGISVDEASRLFEPFFTTKKQGTGLGLSVAKRIVEEHGGEVRFASNPGPGMTFCVSLPVIAQK